MSQQQRLVLRLFGPPELMLDGSPAAGFDSDKVRALLVYLAVETDRPHRRERLAGLLWPDYPERSARTNLRSALANLRQVIGDRDADPPFLHITRQTIQFNAGSSAWIDALAFQDIVQDTQVDRLQEAAALYCGDFLEGFTLSDSAPFEEWTLLQRQALTSQAIDALRRLAKLLEASGDCQRAIPYARRQIDLDPFREESHRQLMRLLALNGQTNEALAQYEVCKQLLSDELGTGPAPETIALYERIQRGEFEPSDSLMPLQPVRGYELRDIIGSGHFGAVYRAFQPVIARDVAVKIILPQYADDPSFIRRFEAEAQIIARLEHPHIVPLYDYWREPGEAYLVMRWLRGGSLQTALARGPWNVEPALQLLDQIAAALAAAHRQGIIHRDIKPANILLDEEGNAYLSDFGIATLTGPGATASKARLMNSEDSSGSLGYLSPETARGEPVTASADIYSLGVVLYELLTALSPFPDIHGQELIDKHLYEPLPEVTILRPDLAESVNNVIHKATAKNPQDRYAGALELAVAFRQALEPGTTPIPTITGVIPNPYKGLRPFQEADAADFFGREELVSSLLAAMEASSKEGKASFLALVGPSGSGKSSVVKAGLIPTLRRGALPGSEDWYIVELTPGSHPLEELEKALLRIAVNPPESLLGQLQEDKRGLLRAVKRALPDDTCRLLLVIDQFEELFTLVNTEEERAHFLDSIATALAETDCPLQVVLTLRADFYDRPLLYPAFSELMRSSTQVILPLTPQELQRAIAGPAEQTGVSLEPGLVAKMVDSVAGQPGGLPLLQFALTELFENRQEDTMTLETYRASGGVDGALSQRAEKLYDSMDAAERESTRQLFLRLVTLGEGVEDTRRRVLRSELESIGQQLSVTSEQSTMHSDPFTGQHPESGVHSQQSAVPNPHSQMHRSQSNISTIIDTFGQTRLLTFDRDPETREPTVEIAHEALLSAWDRLGGWLRDGRDDIRLERRLAAAAEEWQNAQCGDSYLLRGARLVLFEEWAANSDIALTALEEEYLAASVTAREARHAEEEARRQVELRTAQELVETRTQANRRLRWLAVGLAVILIFALGAAFLAWKQSQRSAEQTRLAMARELTAASLRALDEDPERSILLALEAAAVTQDVDQFVLPETEEALHEAIMADRLLYSVPGQGSVDYAGYPDRNGSQLATDSFDGLDIWDAATGQPLLSISGHENGLSNLVYSEDGRRLASTGYDGTARLWDTVTGEELLTLPTEGLTPVSPALSPDGSLLAISTEEGPVLVWDAQTGNKVAELQHDDFTTGIDFSPDGSRLAVTSFDWNGYVWDTSTWERVLTLSGHEEDANDVVFSPDGSRLATVSTDGTARVWDASTGEELTSMFHGAWVFGVDFSPDGTRIASGGTDGRAIVWEADTGRELLTLAGHTGYIGNVAFSPDGDRLATGSSPDGQTRVWDISPAGSRDWITLTGHQGLVFTLAYSPDGQRLASGSYDGTIKLWDVASGEELQTLQGHTGEIARIAFAPDGRRLASAGYDGTAKMWDLDSGEAIFTIEPDAGVLWGLDISPDGDSLATGAQDGSITIWDAVTGEELSRLAGHPAPIFRVNYSPDGEHIVSAGWDWTSKVWDVTTGEEQLTLSGHEDEVNQAVFSQDGSQLATASTDGTVRLWDSQTGELLQTLVGHADTVWDVEFSPDGSRLASGGFDGVLRVWDAQSGKPLLAISHGLSTPDLTYSPDGKFLSLGADDATIRTFILPIEDLLTLAESRVTRSLNEQECAQYLHLDQCPDQAEE